eukprot:TRINITY_DN2283_c3_g1_i1.p1 TRINITY_DN2283_c3_g1~~TRINITY_DN2283_c3_g1_i1.p1  ORF type:complete len:338 (+),score=108.51 TRINITY_DN2283_c3_g1_i1:89-1015(+)
MPPVASLFPSHKRPVRVERPNYGEHDIGLGKELVKYDTEKKKALDHYTGVKARLAMLQSEEAKVSIQLRKAAVYQRALDQKRQVTELKEVDRQRKFNYDEQSKTEKQQLRNYERDRKERARDRMEELFVKKKNDITKDKISWERTKLRYSKASQEYVTELTNRAKEDKETGVGRRQRIQDDLDTAVVNRVEERVKEKRLNEGLMRQRREQDISLRAAQAREQREIAKEHQQSFFENKVRDKKSAVVETAVRKVNSNKTAASDMAKEAARLEHEEYKLRQKLDQQKQLLLDIPHTPLATATPRMVRRGR